MLILDCRAWYAAQGYMLPGMLHSHSRKERMHMLVASRTPGASTPPSSPASKGRQCPTSTDHLLVPTCNSMIRSIKPTHLDRCMHGTMLRSSALLRSAPWHSSASCRPRNTRRMANASRCEGSDPLFYSENSECVPKQRYNLGGLAHPCETFYRVMPASG